MPDMRPGMECERKGVGVADRIYLSEMSGKEGT